MSESREHEVHPVVRESRDRRPVVAGAVATLAFTGAFFVLPAVAPVSALRRAAFETSGAIITGNPLLNLRLFGGFAGGLVAGYVSGGRWTLGARNGALAGVYGLAALYLLYVAYSIADAIAAGAFPPPIYVIVVVPAVFLLPLLAIYLVSGGIGGALSGALSS